MCPSLISFMLLDYIVLKGKVRVSLWVCLKVIPVVLNTVTLKVRNGWRKDKKKKTNGSQSANLLPVPICPTHYFVHKEIEVWR